MSLIKLLAPRPATGPLTWTTRPFLDVPGSLRHTAVQGRDGVGVGPAGPGVSQPGPAGTGDLAN